MTRVIHRHRTVLKLVLAASVGITLAWGVWWSDGWADVPSRLGRAGPLYETHVLAIGLVIPLALLTAAYWEQRCYCLLAISPVLNVGYWGQWQVLRYDVEHQGGLPLGRFLVGPPPGGCGFTMGVYYTTAIALATIPLAVAARWWSPRVLQDGTLCPHCGYCLRGLPELRCPECGRLPELRDLDAGRLGLVLPERSDEAPFPVNHPSSRGASS